MSATTVSIMPPSADFRPVPKIASTISVHWEISEKCSSQVCSSPISTTVTPRRPRMSRLVRASPRTSATEPMTKTAASTPRWISVRATTNPSPPLLPRPHRTPTRPSSRASYAASIAATTCRPGVLHQHQRRYSDFLDGVAIGLAHLRGVEDPHGSFGTFGSSVAQVARSVLQRYVADAHVRPRLRQRPHQQRSRCRHLRLRPRLPLRRRHLRDDADVSRAAVSVRPAHAAAAQLSPDDRARHSVHRRGPGLAGSATRWLRRV